ncbi:MAG: ABC transporter permease [Candidatus Nanoarchaeia archaeon]|nr:ABC transporter permease [Candidatus Nanoarchaeia archaeon]
MNSPVYIMWLRQIKRYWRSKARVIGSLAQPLLFLVALGFGFGPIFEKAGGGNYIEFLAPGIIAMSILFTAMFNGIEVIWDRQFGFLKETLVAPVSRYKIMLGRTLGGATVAMIQGFLVLIISLFIGFRISNIPLMFVSFIFMFITAILFTALGTAIASKLEDMQGFQLIMNFIIMPLFFLSGALFPIDSLPGALAFVTKLNPLSYGVDGIRGALIGTFHLGIFNDFLILIIITGIITLIGTYLFSKVEV